MCKRVTKISATERISGRVLEEVQVEEPLTSEVVAKKVMELDEKWLGAFVMARELCPEQKD